MEENMTKENIAAPVKKRRRRKPLPVLAFIDTEFNAFDYYGQNGGTQEIIQIGMVITKGGKIIDNFSSYCALKKGHVLSKRSIRLTGIQNEDLKNAPSFEAVLETMNTLLDEHLPIAIYAYGSEDKLQMINTARLHRLDKATLRHIDHIEDNMHLLASKLGVKKRSNLSLSVKDLCTICEIDADKPHDAYNDALYLAQCSEKIRKGDFSAANVQTLLDKKLWMSNYRIARRIKESHEHLLLDDSDLAPIRALIAKLQEDGGYPDYQLQAILDDILMLSGRIPELDKK